MSTIPLRLWPESERPREKLLKLGPAALTEAELLAILLQTGTPGRTAGRETAPTARGVSRRRPPRATVLRSLRNGQIARRHVEVETSRHAQASMASAGTV